LHLVGKLFPHINHDAQSKSHHICRYLKYVALYTNYQCSVVVKEGKVQWIAGTLLDDVYCASSSRRFERYWWLNTKVLHSFGTSRTQQQYITPQKNVTFSDRSVRT